MRVLLEVSVVQERDVPGAVEGGADRLHLVGPDERSPEITTASAVCRESGLPVFVLLRLRDSWTTTTTELTALIARAQDYLAVGAAGVSFGFLDEDLEVDSEACAHLATALGVPWTFHRAVDDALDPRRSWRRLRQLPGLVHVCSAGSPRGLGEGYDDLLAMATSEPDVARLLMPGGGLLGEHVPWLLRAGVRAFHLSDQARPGGSAKAYVDAALVRSWRLLLNDALDRLVDGGPR